MTTTRQPDSTPTTTVLLTYGGDATGNGGHLERVSIHLAYLAVLHGIAQPATAGGREDLQNYDPKASA